MIHSARVYIFDVIQQTKQEKSVYIQCLIEKPDFRSRLKLT